jgi:hypothetical protein
MCIDLCRAVCSGLVNKAQWYTLLAHIRVTTPNAFCCRRRRFLPRQRRTPGTAPARTVVALQLDENRGTIPRICAHERDASVRVTSLFSISGGRVNTALGQRDCEDSASVAAGANAIH